jgi:hypothetical protein
MICSSKPDQSPRGAEPWDSTCDVSIVPHFKALKDPRIERTKKHRLIEIIVMALGSMMVGGDGFTLPPVACLVRVL